MPGVPIGSGLAVRRACPECGIKMGPKDFIRRGETEPRETCNYCAALVSYAAKKATERLPLSTVPENENQLDEIAPVSLVRRMNRVVYEREAQNKATGKKKWVVRRGESLYGKSS